MLGKRYLFFFAKPRLSFVSALAFGLRPRGPASRRLALGSKLCFDQRLCLKPILKIMPRGLASFLIKLVCLLGNSFVKGLVSVNGFFSGLGPE